MLGIGSYGQYIYGLGYPQKIINANPSIRVLFASAFNKTLRIIHTTMVLFKDARLSLRHQFQSIVDRAVNLLTTGTRAVNSVVASSRASNSLAASTRADNSLANSSRATNTVATSTRNMEPEIN